MQPNKEEGNLSVQSLKFCEVCGNESPGISLRIDRNRHRPLKVLQLIYFVQCKLHSACASPAIPSLFQAPLVSKSARVTSVHVQLKSNDAG